MLSETHASEIVPLWFYNYLESHIRGSDSVVCLAVVVELVELKILSD